MPLLEKHISCCEQCGAPLSSSSALGCLNCLLLGGPNDSGTETRRFQHYEICLREDGVTLDELGRGAMGITYRARDINLDSPAALKIINAGNSGSPGARERFRREAQIAARLRHPNVASVFHFGETEGGQCFYAMELVEGETLEARIRRDGPLPTMVVLDVAIQIARALVAAEAHGLVHRDLKPGNLMVVANDADDAETPVVKVIDFGLAKAITATLVISGRPHLGFSGTPEFASPEQFRAGETQLDTRSDIYSLGATLWYLLCGQTPFANRTADEMHEPPLPVEQLAAAHVPAHVIGLLRSMLATDPADRPESARNLLIALQRCRLVVETTPRRRKRRRLVALALGLLIIGAVGVTNYFYRHQHVAAVVATTPVIAPKEKSIAVLPFENLSANKENAYFAAGVQDGILSDLAKIADLKVISGASSRRYDPDKPRNSRQIGRELGVAHLLEGSVQRTGNHLRINVQFVDTHTDSQLWFQTYDLDSANLFTVQSEIAQTIAEQLQSKISESERAAIAQRPTTDPAAYDLYLKAQALFANSDSMDRKKEAQLLEEAVARDPRFVAARCLLARVYLTMYWHNEDHTDRRLGTAKRAIDQAAQQEPDAGEVHLAKAYFYYWGSRDYVSALTEAGLASASLPNDGSVLALIAYIERRRGHWEESTAHFEKALSLDPRDVELADNLVENYRALRRYADAARIRKELLSWEPNALESQVVSGLTELGWKADTHELRAAVSGESAQAADVQELAEARLNLALLERDYLSARDALTAYDQPNLEDMPQHGFQIPREWYEGVIARGLGEAAEAQAAFARARDRASSIVRQRPDDAKAIAVLARIEADLGHKEVALREGQRAVDLLPIGRDALDGPDMLVNLAGIYAIVGERDHALDLLKTSAATPAGVTYGSLKLDPVWEPLRGDPRFEKIVASLAPKEGMLTNN